MKRKRKNPRGDIALRVGRLKRGGDAVADIVFVRSGRSNWSEPRIRAWLRGHGFRARELDWISAGRGRDWWRARITPSSRFVPSSLHTIDLSGWERVKMATNARKPKRKKKSARKKHARSRPRAKRTVTTTRSVKLQTNARKKRRRRRARKPKQNPKRTSTRWTVAFPPSAIRALARLLPKARGAEMRKHVRRHPRGGVYVALPSWHGSVGQARKLRERIRVVLVYEAGRRRKRLTAVQEPRVVAVP